MPKKKLSPEEMQAQFNEWKGTSPEYSNLHQLIQLKKDLPVLNEITPDITEKWQPFLDEFIKVGPIFKIKGATIKSLLQEQLRTAFFGGVNKRDEPFTIDQFNLDFINKDTPKNCRHVKNTFVDFFKCIDDLDNQSEETYLDWKKNKIIYKYKEFCKFFKDHIKKDKGHSETKVLLEKVLKPFQKLMETSAKLTLFELNSKTEVIIAENYFQFIADVKSFSLSFQEILGILNTYAKDKVKTCPNVYSTFKKLYYQNWENNKIESYFINPLLEAFNLLRTNLFKLYSMGMDFWKQPLSENNVFVENVIDYLEKEKKAEDMVGNILCRTQTNFFYTVCCTIYNSPLKTNFLIQEKKIMEKTLPQLLILRSLCHVNKVIAKKVDSLLKKEGENTEASTQNDVLVQTSRNMIFSKAGEQLNFALMNALQPNKDFTPQSLIPEGIVYKENVRTLSGVDLELVFNENNKDDLDQFGRLLIWSDYLSKDDHQTFVSFARSIKDMNRARLNDLEDYIIVNGMMSSAENYLTDRTGSIEKMNALNNLILEEKKKGLHEQRPPFLWNDPLALSEIHNIRFSSNSIFENSDSATKSLYDFVELFAEKLKTYNEGKWKDIIESSIGVFEKPPFKE